MKLCSLLTHGFAFCLRAPCITSVTSRPNIGAPTPSLGTSWVTWSLAYLPKVPQVKEVKGLEQLALLHAKDLRAGAEERPDVLQAQELRKHRRDDSRTLAWFVLCIVKRCTEEGKKVIFYLQKNRKEESRALAWFVLCIVKHSTGEEKKQMCTVLLERRQTLHLLPMVSVK